MKTYRIKKYESAIGSSYLVQRKSVFGFWYSMNLINTYTYGRSWEFQSFDGAKKFIKNKITPIKTSIVWQSQP